MIPTGAGWAQRLPARASYGLSPRPLWQPDRGPSSDPSPLPSRTQGLCVSDPWWSACLPLDPHLQPSAGGWAGCQNDRTTPPLGGRGSHRHPPVCPPPTSGGQLRASGADTLLADCKLERNSSPVTLAFITRQKDVFMPWAALKCTRDGNSLALPWSGL